MSERGLKLGVLGSGQYFHSAHLPHLRTNRTGIDVVALCRRSLPALVELSSEFPAAALFTDWEQFLQHPSLDCVLISTPHCLHYNQVKGALLRDLHVLVDKPLCLDAEQAEELVVLAEARRRVVSVAYNYHYWSHFQAARRLIAQGRLGRLTSVACLGSSRATNSPILDPTSWFHDPAQSGGGSMASGGTHRLDAILWLTGLLVQSLYARMSGPKVDLDYQASLTLQLEGGVVAALLNEAQAPEWRLEISIYGELGALFIRNQALQWIDAEGLSQRIDYWPEETNALADFTSAVVHGTPTLVDAECGYWAVAAVQAAYASARSGLPQRVRPLSDYIRVKDGVC